MDGRKRIATWPLGLTDDDVVRLFDPQRPLTNTERDEILNAIWERWESHEDDPTLMALNNAHAERMAAADLAGADLARVEQLNQLERENLLLARYANPLYSTLRTATEASGPLA